MRLQILLTLSLVACNGGIQTQPNTSKDDSEVDDSSDPDIELDATAIDFGIVGYGAFVPGSVTVTNKGGQDLIIESIGTASPFSVSPLSLTLEGGGSTRLTLNVQLTSYGAAAGELTLISNDPDEGTVVIPLTANTLNDVDGDGHDLIEAGGDDCDDGDALVHPGATEQYYDGIDENCDGANDYDQDGDGYETDAYNADPDFGGGDCQDVNSDYYPGAPDVPYDNRDTNCLGDDDWDFDGDGYQTALYGVGSDCDDDDPNANTNSAEAFNGKDDDCDGTNDNASDPELSGYIYDADNTTDQTGYSMAVGDLDDDGFAEVIIGSPYGNGNASGTGTVAIADGYSLPSSGTDVNRMDWFIEGINAGDRIGDYVSVMGDYDGDGYQELAIGASNYSSGYGAVYLISGDEVTSNGDLTDSMTVFTGNASGALGRGIVSSLDLDGDAQDEMVAMYYTGSYNAVALKYGDANPVASVDMNTMDALITTTGSEMAFYRNAPVGADMDGDGYEDLLLSDGAADQGSYTNNGAAWILWGDSTRYNTHGGQSGISAIGTTVLQGTATSAGVAWATQAGDDWDGDGDAELWAFNHADGLYAYEGRPRDQWTILSTTDAVVYYEWASSSTDVEQLRMIGDWSGDGIGEMMAFLEDDSTSYGSMEVFPSEFQSGSETERLGYSGSLNGSSEYGSGNLGYGLSPAPADLEGDGDMDIAVGDPGFSSNEGQAYVMINRQVD